jgi:hypothetical protein
LASPPDPILLWSTNTYLKWWIAQRFLDDVHRVWCSPTFESAKLSPYAIGAGQPATSDPATIYRELKAYVARPDNHNYKVNEQKKNLKALAARLHGSGRIDESARNEIIALVKFSTPMEWRPLVYVIPYGPVKARVQEVDRKDRASHEPEFIIPDLAGAEFQMIEP